MMESLGPGKIADTLIVILCIFWLGAFFQFVCPWLMTRAGKKLYVRVEKSYEAPGAGTYTTLCAASTS